MSIYGRGAMTGGRKTLPLNVSINGTWNRDGGYSPVDVNVPASAVTRGTVVITTNGIHDVTEFKNVRVDIGAVFAATSPMSGITYINGLPNDWNIMKEIGMAISEAFEASESIDANTTGSIYVNKENKWAYKITPGDTINVTSKIGTYTYAVMGFNNFALANQGNYGGVHKMAGLTFGAVKCIVGDEMNSTDTNSGGWGKSLMRTSTMPTLEKGMPETMAQVRVLYNDNNENFNRSSNDFLFLPAEKEVFGINVLSPTTEGDALTQFAYYKNGGSTIKSISVPAVHWWLRSVFPSYSNYFCCVLTSGDVGYANASNTKGVAPCFCV